MCRRSTRRNSACNAVDCCKAAPRWRLRIQRFDRRGQATRPARAVPRSCFTSPSPRPSPASTRRRPTATCTPRCHRADPRSAAGLRLPGAPRAADPRHRRGDARGCRRRQRSSRVRIQPGIFFADDPAFKGKPRELVAQDYVYSIKRFYDPQYNSSDLYLFETAQAARLERAAREGAQAAARRSTTTPKWRACARSTATRLRITLGEPDPRFIYMLAAAVLSWARWRARWSSSTASDIGAHPVGTGAFRLKSWRRASRIELERSPNFRDVRLRGHAGRRAAGAGDRRAHLQAAACRWWTQVRGRHRRGGPAALAVVPERQLPLARTCPAPTRRIAAPHGELAPFLQKKGVRAAARRCSADMAHELLLHGAPAGGRLHAATRWRCAARSAWPTTAQAYDPARAAAAWRCRRSRTVAAVHLGLRPGLQERDERVRARPARAPCSTCTATSTATATAGANSPTASRWC